MTEEYKKYNNIMQKIADVSNASAVLQWDQEVYMPENGASARSGQLATLAGMAHELSVSKELGELLNKLNLEVNLPFLEKKNIYFSLMDYNDRKKYSTEFVERLSRKVSEGFNAWQEAKKKNDFSIFSPVLTELVEIKREESELLGYREHPYDALLDQYEKGLKTSEVELLFNDVKIKLQDLVQRILKKDEPENAFMHKYFDKQKQWEFGIFLLKKIGFDFKSGRQDISTHPFTTSFSPSDVRITTRINENDLAEMIWSCIHEGGHALYEQGLNPEYYGLPAGQYLSLGIHESQSRLWENNVGRSREFWEHFFPILKKYFPEELNEAGPDALFKAMNKVQPSLIRTNSDELTYHFHVMIRFEIEKGLIEGSIKVKDLPGLWNSKYKEYLNIEVPSDSQGVLQDVHWSHGSFGYFPTYSIGSFYAAQFFNQAKKEIPGLIGQIMEGQLMELLGWLRKNIHSHGRTMSSSELCAKITGEPLNFKYFMNYAEEKYRALYF